MSAWWWVPIGLAAWFGIALAVGLLLGPGFRHSSRARDALDAQTGETPSGRDEPPQDGPRAALQASRRGHPAAGDALQRAGLPVGWHPLRHERVT